MQLARLMLVAACASCGGASVGGDGSQLSDLGAAPFDGGHPFPDMGAASDLGTGFPDMGLPGDGATPALDMAVACEHWLGDEDGDGVTDQCDRCPTVADNQADGDGDGVGDACDPHPGQPIDEQLFFDGFNDPAFSAGRYDYLPQGTGGAWAIVDGKLQQMVGNPSFRTALVHGLTPGATVRVETVATALTAGGQAEKSAGLVWASGGATSGTACAVDTSDLQPVELHLYRLDRDLASVLMGAGPALVAKPVTLVGANDGASERCDASATVNQQPLVASAKLQGGAPAGSLGVRAVATSATFDYLYVLQSK